jgi:hypothetical protein
MPTQTLKAQTEMDFTPDGIWFYLDDVGYEAFNFEKIGAYQLYCQYENLTSNTLDLVLVK